MSEQGRHTWKIWVKALLMCSILLSCNITFSQIKVYDEFDDFEEQELMISDNDSVYVFNYWATWCVPCVKELPHFEALNKKGRAFAGKVVLVSLDFKEHLDSRLVPFVEKKGLKSEVILLADTKSNSWINRVDKSWTGAIPATVIYWKGEKYFFEKSYHSLEEIENEIEKIKQL